MRKDLLTLDSIVVQGFTVYRGRLTGNIQPLLFRRSIPVEVRSCFLNDEMQDMQGPVAKLLSQVLIERLGLRFPAEISFGEDTIFNFSIFVSLPAGGL